MRALHCWPARPRALRPALRARRLRRRVRGHPDRRGQPRHRAQGAHRPAQPRPPRRRRRRGRTPATAPASCCRSPTRSCARSSTSSSPAPARTPSARRSSTGDADDVAKTRQQVEELADEEGLTVLGWRDVPVDPELLGATARGVMPLFSQLFVAAAGARADRHGARAARLLPAQAGRARDRGLLPARSARAPCSTRACSPPTSSTGSSPTSTDERVASALAVVHSRFSTNTFPSWPLAHPFRYIAHNGEINTVMGNRNWMRAREALLDSDLIPGDLERLFPICTPGASDSAQLRRGARAAAHGRPLAARTPC